MSWTWIIRSRDGGMNDGGEVGVLQRWENGREHDWWRWSVEFSNRTSGITA